MVALTLNVNGKKQIVDVNPDTPLLWILRDTLGLTGTKYGCGMALCGSCTVHLDGEATRSCVTPVSYCEGKSVVTIEGLARADKLHPVQEAWIEEDVPQCGYCQSGMIMSAAAVPTIEFGRQFIAPRRPEVRDDHHIRFPKRFYEVRFRSRSRSCSELLSPLKGDSASCGTIG